MKIYTALLKADAEPLLVREGFAWGAAILGPVWLAAHRAWIAAAISLAAYVLVTVLVPRPAATILTAGMAIILGFTGRDLHRWSLEHRGYLLVHVLMASNADAALARLLTHRPDLTGHFRPAPA
jgi:hypothetical protein